MEEQKTGINIKKTAIITAIVIVVMALIAVILMVAIPKNATETDQSTQQTANFESDYTNAMQLYKHFNGQQIPADELEEEAKTKGQSISVRYVEKTGTIITNNQNETITFNIIKEEDDAPEMAIDFVYHEQIDSKDTFVMQSGEKTFQHYNGAVTNEFESIDDAFADHLLIHK